MPGSWVGPHYPDVGLFEDIARVVERGLFDMIFFGDGSGIPNTWERGIDAAVRRGVAWPRLAQPRGRAVCLEACRGGRE